MTAVPVSVVICAYTMERWDELCAAVRSAAAQSPAPDEIVLVVDYNTDLLERARRELEPEVALLRTVSNHRKQGLSGARNTAVEKVGGDVVVFLDDDAHAEPGWLAALLRHYADPSVIAVGGVARPVWPADRARPRTLPAADPAARGELDWVVGCTYAGQPTSAQPVRNLMGCNMSLRREVFARVGGFSEDLGRVGKTPLGCEETELCIRATTAIADSSIIFEPEAMVRHHVSQDRLTWRYLRRRCYAEGVSKAAVSAMVGSEQALATERQYATKVLPLGVLREAGRALGNRQARAAGVESAAAIVTGLGATVLGYGRAKLTRATVKQGGSSLVLERSPRTAD